MKVNGEDENPYMKWKIRNVPNHQPDSSMTIGVHENCIYIYSIYLIDVNRVYKPTYNFSGPTLKESTRLEMQLL